MRGHAVAIEPGLAAALEEILRERSVTSVYQPIVDLASGNVVAYEALARGPDGSPLRPPGKLFDAARQLGRLAELDWVCRVAAVRGAMEGGLCEPFTLFCNMEPETIDSPPPDDLRATWEEAKQQVRVMTEITERALTVRPAELLSAAGAIRESAWGLALDDVGTDAASLALMPFLDPDVIKLDLRVIQETPSAALAEVVNAVNAEAERSELTVVSEGIETEEHLRTSLAFGAHLGQGWLFGRPGPLPDPLPEPGRAVQMLGRRLRARLARPSRILGALQSIRRGTKPILLSMTHHIENQALALGESAVVLAIFEDARYFSGRTRELYERLAAETAFVGVLAPGMPPDPAPGVRGGAIAPGDDLHREWGLAVVAPHFACALLARPVGDAARDAELEYDFALTYNREFAVETARNMMSKLAPPGHATGLEVAPPV